MIFWKLAKIKLGEVAKFYRPFYGGASLCLPPYKHFCTFHWCRWIFAKCSASKVKKKNTETTVEGSIIVEISIFAKFNGDILETGEDIAPRSREIFQTFLWWGLVCASHRTNTFALFIGVDGFSLSALHQKLKTPWKTLFIPS